MKKILQTIILFVLTSNVFGQVATIKVRRIDSSSCDYKFVANNDIADKMLRLSKFMFSSPDKFKSKTADEIRSKLRLIREKPYYVNKFYFDSLIKDVCVVNKFKLTKIEVKSSEDTSHIQINFTYNKIKK